MRFAQSDRDHADPAAAIYFLRRGASEEVITVAVESGLFGGR